MNYSYNSEQQVGTALAPPSADTFSPLCVHNLFF